MKLLFIALAFTFFSCTEARKFDDLRKYLAEHDESPKSTLNRDAPVWLKNSNTIGLGYNPLYESPVCYTGACQGEGFQMSVVKQNFGQPAIGSCTSKLIPDFVELHCIPSADLHTSTETISTLKQLSESTSKGISFGADVKYQMFSAGYSHSKETRSMIDQMIKQDRTAIFTRAQITFGKLTMFEPSMILSDNFRKVIDDMPCCDDDSMETDEYIHEFLIDYFGLTFVTEVMLGGIAQETVFIDNREMREMQSKGKDVSHSANIGFYVTFNITPTSSYNKTEQDQFMKSVKDRHSTKLGGEPSAETMHDWIKSVPENPVIVNYAVKDILTLLTRKHFPNDSHIHNKSKLVEMAIQQYLDSQKPICFNNCTDSNHGQCDVSSATPFLLGTCKCRFGWYGNDCSEKDYSRNFTRIPNWNLPGNDLMNIDNPFLLNSYEACASLCYWHGQCYSFTWNSVTGMCFLKKSFKPNSGILHADIESGTWGTSELQPDIGPWGNFYDYAFCPKDSWAYGFQQRVEALHGEKCFSDNSALNAIRLYCRKKDGTHTGSISSHDGLWGDWSAGVYCNRSGQFLISAIFRIDDSGCGCDCTSANDFMSHCQDINTGIYNDKYLVATNGAWWGNWKRAANCPNGSAICGISSKFEPSLGISQDDTAMNGARFICCSL